MKLFIKQSLVLIFTILISSALFADQLVFIKTSGAKHSKQLVENPNVSVHFYNDNFVIASTTVDLKDPFVLLDQNAWESNRSFYIVYLNEDEVSDYISDKREQVQLHYKADNFVIVSLDETTQGVLKPYRTDGQVRIQSSVVSMPKERNLRSNKTLDPDPFVEQLIAQVDPENVTATVQHLQNYGTRNAYAPQSVVAQGWIKDQFVALGLTVEEMDFSMPNGSASDNVIATQLGTKYPTEYVICGSHFDSYSNAGAAPGADDNASGTAAVLEIARILSQYSFDRTIIYCTFSGEEYGLYGSEAYASRAAQRNMDILGYYNLDMIGYLKPTNTTIKSSLIYPASAQELATFYMDVCATYLPSFVVQPGSLSGGDSDHTSFNNNGFMGIFPFEDAQNYSPYIHSANDIVGTSYNNATMAGIFTQASLASIVTMANRINPPRGLAALPGDQMVELNWAELFDIDHYKVYRNNTFLSTSATNQFFDMNVENGTSYSYYVTAVYSGTGIESPPSNSVTTVPMPPLALPYIIDFEDGTPYWEFEGGWGISSVQAYSPTNSITESPSGQYPNQMESFAYLRPFSLNLGYTNAQLSFWTRYDIEASYDFMYLELTTNGDNWTQLAVFDGTQNSWQQKNYPLNTYLGEPYVQIRFRFTSDNSVTKDGMYIDDFQLQTAGGYQGQNLILMPGWNSLSSYILPAQTELSQVFAPIQNSLIAVQTKDGLYYPAENINTIGNWDATSGFKVKMNSPASLTIAGPTQATTLLNLSEGWNLIPVPSACDVSIFDLTQGVANQIIIIKEINSNTVYYPAVGIYSLQTLKSGNAYLIKCTDALQLQFPACKSLQLVQGGNERAEITATATTHIVAFAANVLNVFAPGDKLIAYSQSQLPVGEISISDPSLAVAVALFGNDSLNSSIDGLLPGELVTWKLLELASSMYYDVNVTYDLFMPNQGNYAPDGLSYVTNIAVNPTGISEKTPIINVYPNPASKSLFISYTGLHIIELELIGTNGKRLMLLEPKNEQIIDISSLPNGVYFIRAVSSQGVIVEKLIKNMD